MRRLTPGLESLILWGAGRILGIRASPRGKEGDDMADGAVVSLGPYAVTTAVGFGADGSAAVRRLVAGLTPNREDGSVAHGGR